MIFVGPLQIEPLPPPILFACQGANYEHVVMPSGPSCATWWTPGWCVLHMTYKTWWPLCSKMSKICTYLNMEYTKHGHPPLWLVHVAYKSWHPRHVPFVLGMQVARFQGAAFCSPPQNEASIKIQWRCFRGKKKDFCRRAKCAMLTNYFPRRWLSCILWGSARRLSTYDASKFHKHMLSISWILIVFLAYY